MAACFWWTPSNEIDRGGVEGELVDALPLGILLAVDEDAAVVRGAGEDGAVFGVCPRDAPDGTFVTTIMSEKIGDWSIVGCTL
jgi:hypothetical protein